MLEQYRLAVREARFVRLSLLLAAALNLLTWVLVLWFALPRLAKNPFFALHYTVYFGVDRIGPPWRLGSTPLLGTALLLIDAAMITAIYRRSRQGSSFIAAVTVGLEALLLVAGFLNILLNL